MKSFASTLKFKLIVSSILCTALVSLGGNLFLYDYLNGIIVQRSARINEIYLNTLSTQLDDAFEDLTDLGVLCASDPLAVTALEYRTVTLAAQKAALTAQVQLNAYLASSPVAEYVDTLLLFNVDGQVIAGTAQYPDGPDAFAKVTAQPIYQEMTAQTRQPSYLFDVCTSIKKTGRRVVAMLCPVRGLSSTLGRSYLYMELSLDLFADAVDPYAEMNDIFVADADGVLLTAQPLRYPEGFTAAGLTEGENRIGDATYEVTSVPLARAGLRLYRCIQQSAWDQEAFHIFFTLVGVVVTSLVLAAVLAVLVSAYHSRPISRLDSRLRRIAANDFSFDPEIERPSGELGQIGRTVNEMSGSISHLLRETEEMYEKRRRIEIDLLQSQVNPHFLYNTLDSIRWMAVIQKNPGIEAMTRSLSNLLKNIAKGTQDRILLSEELSLLQDYVSIQSVRYMEAFTYKVEVPGELLRYRIVKLTLQPLVENAIFHGIEPTGEDGTVTVSAKTEGADLLLFVTDTGVGIQPDQLATILSREHTRSGDSLNGIGLANVHKRLQLQYGPRYGLTIESEPGKYTRVTVRIPKEE